jgi:hypothetical protein
MADKKAKPSKTTKHKQQTQSNRESRIIAILKKLVK